jgi:hypothetical protein
LDERGEKKGEKQHGSPTRETGKKKEEEEKKNKALDGY